MIRIMLMMFLTMSTSADTIYCSGTGLIYAVNTGMVNCYNGIISDDLQSDSLTYIDAQIIKPRFGTSTTEFEVFNIRSSGAYPPDRILVDDSGSAIEPESIFQLFIAVVLSLVIVGFLKFW